MGALHMARQANISTAASVCADKGASLTMLVEFIRVSSESCSSNLVHTVRCRPFEDHLKEQQAQ